MSIRNSGLPHPRYRGAKAVVLGASGFIGRWVAKALCEAGAQVTLLVRDRSAGARIFNEIGISGDVVELDLQTNPGSLGKLFRRVRPSILFNLAAYGVDRSERDESAAHAINTELVRTLCIALEGTQDGNWAGQQLVHVGSALEYGMIGGDLAEDSVPNPTTLYGQSKLKGTQVLTDTCRASGVRGVTVRLFSVYGPGEHSDRLLPSLMAAALAQRPVQLTDGQQLRDFTYVEEVAEGLLRIGVMECSPGAVVNLASGRLVSVREFIEIAASVLEMAPGQLEFGAIATRTDEMAHGPVSTERLRRAANWVPTMGIRTGIRRALELTRILHEGGRVF